MAGAIALRTDYTAEALHGLDIGRLGNLTDYCCESLTINIRQGDKREK
jgi:hypothetical protein